MKLVCPWCRTRLSAEDFAFIQATLAQSNKDAVALKSLLLDPGELDKILDNEVLLEGIQITF